MVETTAYFSSKDHEYTISDEEMGLIDRVSSFKNTLEKQPMKDNTKNPIQSISLPSTSSVN